MDFAFATPFFPFTLYQSSGRGKMFTVSMHLCEHARLQLPPAQHLLAKLLFHRRLSRLAVECYRSESLNLGTNVQKVQKRSWALLFCVLLSIRRSLIIAANARCIAISFFFIQSEKGFHDLLENSVVVFRFSDHILQNGFYSWSMKCGKACQFQETISFHLVICGIPPCNYINFQFFYSVN